MASEGSLRPVGRVGTAEKDWLRQQEASWQKEGVPKEPFQAQEGEGIDICQRPLVRWGL